MSWPHQAIYEDYISGKKDIWGGNGQAPRQRISAVVFIGGYHTEIALMARAALDRGYPVRW